MEKLMAVLVMVLTTFGLVGCGTTPVMQIDAHQFENSGGTQETFKPKKDGGYEKETRYWNRGYGYNIPQEVRGNQPPRMQPSLGQHGGYWSQEPSPVRVFAAPSGKALQSMIPTP
jgi:hypothetical protein